MNNDCIVCGGSGRHLLVEELQCPFCGRVERRGYLRREARLSAMALVRAPSGAGIFPCRLLNISMSGALLAFPAPDNLASDSLGSLLLRIQVPKLEATAPIECEVLRAVRQDGAIFAATGFLDRDEATRMLLGACMA